MERILEPELMDNAEQSQAYWDADIDETDIKAGINLIHLLDSTFNGFDDFVDILDLGCVPGNFTFKLAQKFPLAKITAIDGSLKMLNLANNYKKQSEQQIPL